MKFLPFQRIVGRNPGGSCSIVVCPLRYTNGTRLVTPDQVKDHRKVLFCAVEPDWVDEPPGPNEDEPFPGIHPYVSYLLPADEPLLTALREERSTSSPEGAEEQGSCECTPVGSPGRGPCGKPDPFPVHDKDRRESTSGCDLEKDECDHEQDEKDQPTDQYQRTDVGQRRNESFR